MIAAITMVACTETNIEPSRELDGVYELDEVRITYGDGTIEVFSTSNNRTLPALYEFKEDSMYIYVLQDDEYINTTGRGVYCEWYRGQLLKVGCRQVIAYSDSHITWKQNDWLVTRKFK
tara:strand:- start:676 stop:1032 length:357 start_codon:yes stop_codon:yes gene_type:complete